MSEKQRLRAGELARRRVMREHTSTVRARQLLEMVEDVIAGAPTGKKQPVENVV